MFVMLVDSRDRVLPQGTVDMLADMACGTVTVDSYDAALCTARDQPVDAIVLCEPPPSLQQELATPYQKLLRFASSKRIATVLLTDASLERPGEPRASINVVPTSVSLDELRGRFAMIDRYQAQVRHLENELQNMERLGKRLNEHFREVDQEMRLAARLQRDFLPDVREPISNIQFATLFRPASWVSGDIFDVFRIDEDHTGFYIADAVGHGLASSLLTMFIKRSIVPKRVNGEGYEIAAPSEVLRTLNDALVDQALPHCQFVTACYGIINHKTRAFRYARGGHPYPLLITSEGYVSDLKTSGGLLGLFHEGEFPEYEGSLEVGDKLILYTDGVEMAFQDGAEDRLDIHAYHKCFEEFGGLPVRHMVDRLNGLLETEEGSLSPRDDVTIVALEVLPHSQ